MALVLQLDHSEQDLLNALIARERWAQQYVYEQYYGKMMGICLRYAGSKEEALDLLHEGFIKVFQKINQFKAGTSLPSWINTIIVHTCIDAYRKAVRQRTEEINDNCKSVHDNTDLLSSLTEKEILDAVQQLSPAYRAVFNLFVVEGYSHREISEALQINESTSRSNLLKARTKLQEYFVSRNMEFKAGSY